MLPTEFQENVFGKKVILRDRNGRTAHGIVYPPVLLGDTSCPVWGVPPVLSKGYHSPAHRPDYGVLPTTYLARDTHGKGPGTRDQGYPLCGQTHICENITSVVLRSRVIICRLVHEYRSDGAKRPHTLWLDVPDVYTCKSDVILFHSYADYKNNFLTSVIRFLWRLMVSLK